jgi:hypothetical protein
MNKQKDSMGDSVFVEKTMKLSIGDKPQFTKGQHYIDKQGLKFFFNSLGRENFKKFINEHDVHTNKKGLHFVRRKFGKRNALKTHIKIILRMMKNF